MISGGECARRQRLTGSGGEISLTEAIDRQCEGLPWLVEAHENRSLFLLTWGTDLPLEPPTAELPPPATAHCATRNRVLIYAGELASSGTVKREAKLLRVVCPAEPNARQYAVQVHILLL